MLMPERGFDHGNVFTGHCLAKDNFWFHCSGFQLSCDNTVKIKGYVLGLMKESLTHTCEIMGTSLSVYTFFWLTVFTERIIFISRRIPVLYLYYISSLFFASCYTRLICTLKVTRMAYSETRMTIQYGFFTFHHVYVLLMFIVN
jgi:hypothetical protein